jgi:hypothetical protein
MRFLTFLFAVLLAGSAYADGIPALDRNGNPLRVQRMTGQFIAFDSSLAGDSTNAALDFEFESDYVTICILPISEVVYVRFGTSMVALEGQQGAATPDTNAQFQAGGIGITGSSTLAARAVALGVPGFNDVVANDSELGLDNSCQTHPWATRGLVFNVDTTATATMTVNAFSSR